MLGGVTLGKAVLWPRTGSLPLMLDKASENHRMILKCIEKEHDREN